MRPSRSYLLCAAALTVAVACKSPKQPPVAAGPSIADSAEQVFQTMHTVLTSNGVQRGNLTADTAYVLDETTRFDLRNAHVNFTTELGAPQGTMDAHKGMYSTRTQILEGWGDVVVKLVDGRTLKSPHVIYNQLTHLLSSDTTFTASDSRGTSSGIGFTSVQGGQTFSSFKCLRNCSGSTLVAIPEK
jgi:LPS export ABC transporter protein LptC